MSLKNFIFSKTFLKNTGIAAVIVVGLVMALLIWLNFYTRHGQSRPVPDFKGLTLEMTAIAAKKAKVRYQVIDSVYTAEVPRGCIAEQNPRPGFKVKKWRNVLLTINAFSPEMVAMPNLVNLPKRQAMALIEGAGLEMGSPRYVPDISFDVVLEQLYNGRNIREGDSIQKGSVIDLVLGKGLSNQRTSVPDLIGLDLETAKDRIFGASLTLVTSIYDNTIVNGADSAKSFVYKQNPDYSAEATLQLGSSIYLWFTTDSTKLTLSDSTVVVADTMSDLISGEQE
ncbi:MAG TPA: PASTA domain-containing protein [Bacteroidales bacterium]|jgi:beta-lactam-binding protein with PASTA domain|nr:PASTA domain-containing protein [Bacteroidales bacterium]